MEICLFFIIWCYFWCTKVFSKAIYNCNLSFYRALTFYLEECFFISREVISDVRKCFPESVIERKWMLDNRETLSFLELGDIILRFFRSRTLFFLESRNFISSVDKCLQLKMFVFIEGCEFQQTFVLQNKGSFYF